MNGVRAGHAYARFSGPFAEAMTPEQPLIVGGRVDREGRLVAADARLLALQLGAGGEAGGVVAVPALASLARLARTLGVLVSRGVVAAEADEDIELWVRAQPEGDEVALSIAGWEKRAARVPDERSEAQRQHDFAALESDGSWSCDAALRLTAIAADLGERAGAGDGALLTGLFRLSEDVEGNLPLLNGLALRQAFSGQIAELRHAPGVRVSLHGSPVSEGGYAGFVGGYRWLDRGNAPKRPERRKVVQSERFDQRLEVALRGPLGKIIASADDIAAREHGAIRQDYVNYANDISSAGRHLLGLIDDMSDFQAAEHLDFRVDVETLDLADLARRTAGLLSVRAADKKVKIDAPSVDEIVHARGDFRRVLQVLVNLTTNALRYSPPGSSVWIRTEEEDDLACIVVCDQGQGIAVENHERIFEKFERLDPSEPGGTGLGLYISRQLARAMGGDITVDSAPGMGARFILTLPRS